MDNCEQMKSFVGLLQILSYVATIVIAVAAWRGLRTWAEQKRSEAIADLEVYLNVVFFDTEHDIAGAVYAIREMLEGRNPERHPGTYKFHRENLNALDYKAFERELRATWAKVKAYARDKEVDGQIMRVAKQRLMLYAATGFALASAAKEAKLPTHTCFEGVDTDGLVSTGSDQNPELIKFRELIDETIQLLKS